MGPLTVVGQQRNIEISDIFPFLVPPDLIDVCLRKRVKAAKFTGIIVMTL